ncbi:Zinc finger protein 536 [Portunus trituberculatus]|uniref:Zinc finger protein 536 n=1 Tax=Portunus trituberculatus TaxID=210409 RepID=A0A5B7CLP9_PORTR|nr:Zinc finger protein 536 [Portunus trituberculatus]
MPLALDLVHEMVSGGGDVLYYVQAKTSATACAVVLDDSEQVLLMLLAEADQLRCCEACVGREALSGVVLQAAGGAGAAAVAMVMCCVCGRVFRGRNRHQNLSTHMRIHTGETPFPCPHCPYRAKRKAHLQMHLERIHSPRAAAGSAWRDGRPPPHHLPQPSHLPLLPPQPASSNSSPPLSSPSLTLSTSLQQKQ